MNCEICPEPYTVITSRGEKLCAQDFQAIYGPDANQESFLVLDDAL